MTTSDEISQAIEHHIIAAADIRLAARMGDMEET
jgi:hypothetical protein